MPAPTHDHDALPPGVPAPSFRQELRVVGVVVAFVAVLEIIARLFAPTLDYDRKHIHAFPQLIADLEHRSRSSGNPRVVFMGNSLMRSGLDESAVHEQLRTLHGPEIETSKITPVGTAVLDWIYLYQRYFKTAESHPDVLVVGFYTHHLHDQEPIKVRRLARHFVAAADFPTLWKTDLADFHQMAQSVLCGVSALEGDQPEHQLILLSSVIADYQSGLKTNNRLVTAAAERKARSVSAAGGAGETFQRMEHLIKICQAQRVKLVFVAMPQPHLWELNPTAVSLAETRAAGMLDARAIPGMTEADFEDGYHLGPSGSQKFSRWLAAALLEKLPHS